MPGRQRRLRRVSGSRALVVKAISKTDPHVVDALHRALKRSRFAAGNLASGSSEKDCFGPGSDLRNKATDGGASLPPDLRVHLWNADASDSALLGSVGARSRRAADYEPQRQAAALTTEPQSGVGRRHS